MEEAKKALEKLGKNILKHIGRIILPIILVIAIIITLLAAITYYIFVWVDGISRDEDWGSTPYAASQYISGVSVSNNGSISSNMDAQELWDKMMENGSRVDLYLDSPEELARLMRAEIITQYPDTRENPDEPINWEEVIADSSSLQGIIKFKRADSDGNKTTMSYVDPDTFAYWISQYESNGSHKEDVLTHFTLESTVPEVGNGVIAVGDGVKTDVSDRIVAAAETTPSAGPGYCLAWVDDVYDNAGLPSIRYGSAYEASQHQVVSTDRNNIPIGAAVFGTGSSPEGYGHVGIYLGGGQVIDNQTSGIVISDIDTWLSWQTISLGGKTGWIGWGWVDGNSDNETTKIRGTANDPYLEEYKANGSDTTTGQETVSSSKDNEDEEDAVVNIDKSKLYFIGDSWIDGLKSSGVAETTYFYGQTGKYAGSPEMATSSIPAHNDASGIVLYLGVNNPASFDQMNSLIDELAEKYKDKNIYVVEVSHVGSQYSGSISAEEMNKSIDNYNDRVKAHCEGKENVKFLNVASSVTDSSGWLTNTSDGLHLNGTDAYKIWYDSIISAIENNNNASTMTTKSSEYNAVIATWKQIDTTVTTNDPNVAGTSETVYSITKTKINYEEMVDPYTMPFDLLWALLVMGEDKDFVFELVDLVYNSNIEITIHDNLTVNTDVDEWHYTQQEKVKVDGFVYYTGGGYTTNQHRVDNDIHDPYSETEYVTTKTVVTQTNTVKVDLTRANVWIVDYQKEYSYAAPSESTNTSTVNQEDEQYPEEANNTTTNEFECEHIQSAVASAQEEWRNNAKQEITNETTGETTTTYAPLTSSTEQRYFVAKYYYRYAKIYDNITNTTSTQRYIAGTPTLKEKTDKNPSKEDGPNFVSIFNKSEYTRNKSNIKSAASWLFEIIENNESTADMLDLIKYLLYKATGRDYGVTEFDFSIFYPGGMTSMGSGIYGGTLQEKVWFALINAGYSKEAAAGVMGNIEAESGFNAGVIEGGSGIGAGLCQWSFGRRTQLEQYAASKGKDWTDENTQIEFLIGELTPGGGANGYASYQLVTYNGYSPDDWRNAATPEDAAIAFCWSFERPGIPRMDVRTQAARKYYEEFKDEKMSASAVVQEARGALGVPYVWGGESYTEGMDCSGLVKVCYQRALGVTLPHFTGDLMTDSRFKTVSSIEELTGGDIIVTSSHVGIYTGEGTVIHEPQEGDVCKEVSLSSFLSYNQGALYRHYIGN